MVTSSVQLQVTLLESESQVFFSGLFGFLAFHLTLLAQRNAAYAASMAHHHGFGLAVFLPFCHAQYHPTHCYSILQDSTPFHHLSANSLCDTNEMMSERRPNRKAMTYQTGTISKLVLLKTVQSDGNQLIPPQSMYLCFGSLHLQNNCESALDPSRTSASQNPSDEF